jgi:hypothetical protein
VPSATSRIALLIAVSVNRTGITPSAGLHWGFTGASTPWNFQRRPGMEILTGLQKNSKENRMLLV